MAPRKFEVCFQLLGKTILLCFIFEDGGGCGGVGCCVGFCVGSGASVSNSVGGVGGGDGRVGGVGGGGVGGGGVGGSNCPSKQVGEATLARASSRRTRGFLRLATGERHAIHNLAMQHLQLIVVVLVLLLWW
jgi:hypothetical protein